MTDFSKYIKLLKPKDCLHDAFGISHKRAGELSDIVNTTVVKELQATKDIKNLSPEGILALSLKTALKYCKSIEEALLLTGQISVYIQEALYDIKQDPEKVGEMQEKLIKVIKVKDISPETIKRKMKEVEKEIINNIFPEESKPN